MMHSHQATHGAVPLHVAIIMDGNGRWATRRGLPRVIGHREGAKAVRRIVESAPTLGVGTLTLFAFSSDNWQRPRYEVATLMRLFREYLGGETQRLTANGIRLNVIGRRDRLAAPLCEAIEAAESATAAGQAMLLRVAVDYSARDAILSAAASVAQRNSADPPTPDEFARLLGEVHHSVVAATDVDLLIRTSGELRLSDFLLWECAYAELHFTDRFWPDFAVADLEAAIAEFRERNRRFGQVPHAAVG